MEECWEGGSNSALDPHKLSAVLGVDLQIFTNKDSTTPFDFCVTELSFH